MDEYYELIEMGIMLIAAGAFWLQLLALRDVRHQLRDLKEAFEARLPKAP